MKATLGFGIGLALLAYGCSDDGSAPGTFADNQTSVIVTASAQSGSGPVGLGKAQAGAGTLAEIDSLMIDHAVIVLKDIAFKGGIDTVHTMDSAEVELAYKREEDYGYGWEGKNGKHRGFGAVSFRGPFIVELEDTIPVQVVLDTIPPGTYNGIKFKIHRLRSGDLLLDPTLPDSMLGYSIAVAGSVKDTSGDWTPFLFKANIDEEFKARGNFTVNPGDHLVPYALKFDIASWFTAPDGRILDPNDRKDAHWIRFLIKASLKGRMWCGRDGDNDGDPD